MLVDCMPHAYNIDTSLCLWVDFHGINENSSASIIYILLHLGALNHVGYPSGREERRRLATETWLQDVRSSKEFCLSLRANRENMESRQPLVAIFSRLTRQTKFLRTTNIFPNSLCYQSAPLLSAYDNEWVRW